MPTTNLARPWGVHTAAVIHPDWLSILFTRRAKEAGLPRITIRQLRHSHATALVRADAHP
ncbi:MAG: hypothetical protein ACT4OP_10300 [Actinomycetota bacterium]